MNKTIECPLCHQQTTLDCPSELDKTAESLMRFKWACPECQRIDGRLRAVRAKLTMLRVAIDGASDPDKLRALKSQYAGQRTELRFATQEFEKRLSISRLKKEMDTTKEAGNYPF